jgi:hypothetical protein
VIFLVLSTSESGGPEAPDGPSRRSHLPLSSREILPRLTTLQDPALLTLGQVGSSESLGPPSPSSSRPHLLPSVTGSCPVLETPIPT